MPQSSYQPSATADTDRALALAHASGDSRAFAELFQRYRSRVLAYAFRMLGRRELADEVCAQTFVRILEGRYKPTGSFRAYVFSVAHRACLERLRKRRTARRFAPWIGEVSPAYNPEDEVVRGHRQRQIEAAVAGLGERHRSLLALYYGQELSSREVAAIVGCTDQQVRSQLAYARRLLRQALEASR